MKIPLEVEVAQQWEQPRLKKDEQTRAVELGHLSCR